jgi:glucose-6-phosphate isomerase
MSLYLYTESWDASLEEKGGDAPAWESGRALLADAAACGAAIARYEGSPLPAFARERPDLVGIEGRLGLAEGKDHIVVVGNGGSIRNVWALYQALVAGRSGRRLHLLDGTDPSGLLGALLSGSGGMSPANTLVVPVSKSGNTENVVQEVALLLEKGFPMIAVVSPGPSQLAGLIEEKGLERFLHPDAVGGRYTAGQNNALLPLALAEGSVDTSKKVDAAFAAAHARLAPEVPVEENMAKSLALRFWRAELAGYTELFLPIYGKALAGLGELIVQLVHESYCKAGKGHTVLFAEAPESQHHTNQRYFGGRASMAGLTIRVNSFENDAPLKGEVSLGDFLDLEHAGVVAEAERTRTPHMVLTLDALSAENVASAVALWQWAAVYGGLLREVNPFDQPAVEGSKNATIEMFNRFGPESRRALAHFREGASSIL